MSKINTETKVGVFVVIAVLILGYMSIKVGNLSFQRQPGYEIKVLFESASGLSPDVPVEIAGVEIGRVQRITLKNGKAFVILNIDPSVQIKRDAKAMIKTRGILGDKYIALSPGSPLETNIEPGGRIARSDSVVDLDILMNTLHGVAVDISTLTHSLTTAMGGDKGEGRLKEIFDNLQEMIFTLNKTVQNNQKLVSETILNLSKFSETLNNMGNQYSGEVSQIIDNFSIASDKIIKLMAGVDQVIVNINEGKGTIGRLIKDDETITRLNSTLAALMEISEKINEGKGTLGRLVNEEGIIDELTQTLASFKEISEKINEGKGTLGKLVNEEGVVNELTQTLASVREISEKINEGEGSLGKLLNDEETVDNINAALSGINDFIRQQDSFRTYLDYRGEYLTEEGEFKSYLTLRIQPKEDRYYLLQLVDDSRGKEKVTYITREIDGVMTTEKRVEVEDDFKFSVQIAKRYYDLGLRGGIFESKAGIALDYYFFNDRLNFSLEAFDFGSEDNPHLKFITNFTPLRHIYVTSGVDDFISTNDRRSFFIGAGINFSDEDVKSLISSIPVPTN